HSGLLYLVTFYLLSVYCNQYMISHKKVCISLSYFYGELIFGTFQHSRFISDTTRPRRLQERNGVDYWFVKRNTMESMFKSNLFVEYGHLGEFLYGTTEAAIRCVAQREKKHCLLDSSSSVQHLLARSLFPLVVFVGAQSWRQLQDVIAFDGGSEYQAKELMAKDEEIVRNMRMYLGGVVRERSLEESYSAVARVIHNHTRETWITEIGDPNARLI
ncbi:hypothetical protein PRIPAC_71307, partial [Pristionchus pacificus]